MVLEPLDEILKEFPGLSEEQRRFAEKLYAALSGEEPRDVLLNYGKPVTGKIQDDFVKEFDEFMRKKVEKMNQAAHSGN